MPNTSNEWKYAKINISNTLIPSGTHIRVTNSTNLFHLAVINGQPSVTGCRYGFYTDFNSFDLSNVISNHPPLNYFCVGDTIRLSTDLITNANYS